MTRHGGRHQASSLDDFLSGFQSTAYSDLALMVGGISGADYSFLSSDYNYG
jgi:hypothetical protein